MNTCTISCDTLLKLKCVLNIEMIRIVDSILVLFSGRLLHFFVLHCISVIQDAFGYNNIAHNELSPAEVFPKLFDKLSLKMTQYLLVIFYHSLGIDCG